MNDDGVNWDWTAESSFTKTVTNQGRRGCWGDGIGGSTERRGLAHSVTKVSDLGCRSRLRLPT